MKCLPFFAKPVRFFLILPPYIFFFSTDLKKEKLLVPVSFMGTAIRKTQKTIA